MTRRGRMAYPRWLPTGGPRLILRLLPRRGIGALLYHFTHHFLGARFAFYPLYRRRSSFFFPTIAGHPNVDDEVQIIARAVGLDEILSQRRQQEIKRDEGGREEPAASTGDDVEARRPSRNDSRCDDESITSSSSSSSLARSKFLLQMTLLDELFPFETHWDSAAGQFTEVRESPIHGRGLFATRRIPKGTVVILDRTLVFADAVCYAALTGDSIVNKYSLQFYSHHTGSAFQLPMSPSPLHVINHSCEANLSRGFPYCRSESALRYVWCVVASAPADDGEGGGATKAKSDSPIRMVRWSDATDEERSVSHLVLNSSCDDQPAAPQEKKEEKSPHPATTDEEKQQKEREDSTTRRKRQSDTVVDHNCFVATREIAADEEITLDYSRMIAPAYSGQFRKEFFESKCRCGAALCTGDIYKHVPPKLRFYRNEAERLKAVKKIFSEVRPLRWYDAPPGGMDEKLETRNASTATAVSQDVATTTMDPHDDPMIRLGLLKRRKKFIRAFFHSGDFQFEMGYRRETATSIEATHAFLNTLTAAPLDDDPEPKRRWFQ